MNSQYFSPRTLKVLNRFGDILLPEHEEFPAFSRLGCIEHIDVVAVNISLDDRRSLGALMFFLSVCPDFVLRWMVRKMERPAGMPDFLVDYHAAVRQRWDVTTINRYYGYNPTWDAPDTYIREYEEGSLMVDIIEPGSRKLMWRGMAEAEVGPSSTPQEREQRVSEAVRRMLERFPPEETVSPGE